MLIIINKMKPKNNHAQYEIKTIIDCLENNGQYRRKDNCGTPLNAPQCPFYSEVHTGFDREIVMKCSYDPEKAKAELEKLKNEI